MITIGDWYFQVQITPRISASEEFPDGVPEQLESQVYSTARQLWVGRDDAMFIAWQESRRAQGLDDEPTRALSREQVLDVVQKCQPGAAEINAERDRRILLPKSVTLDGIGTISVDMAGGGRENIGDLGTAALAKASIGDSSTISFRDADNVDHDLTNAQVIAMGLQVAAAVSAIHVAARALKAMDPIPADYADEEHWP